jgi:hypothetical protein
MARGSFRIMRTRSGRWLIAFPLCAIFLLTACDPHIARSNGTLGVSLTTDGRIQIVRHLCDGDAVKEVKLLLHPGTVIGDAADEVAWDITSTSGSAQETFIVGQVPLGFTEVMPFTAQLSAAEDLGVLTETAAAQAVIEFRIDQLRAEMVFSQGELLTPEAFQKQANSACR